MAPPSRSDNRRVVVVGKERRPAPDGYEETESGLLVPGTEIERAPWPRVLTDFLGEWEQGQHCAVIGPSGQGKTTFALEVLNARADKLDAHVIVMANKRRDPLLTRLGWPIVRSWDEISYKHLVDRRVILWPSYGKASTSATRNRQVFVDALDGVIEDGAWTVYLDEVVYFVETLNMRRLLDEYWNTARSSAVTVVGSSQSASWIPRSMTTNQTWLAAFKSRDQEIRKRVAEVAGDRKTYEPIISGLKAHEFMLMNTVSGDGWVTKVH